MTKRWQVVLLWSILAAGLVMHVIFWMNKKGMHYPDEIFQYIEPAFVKLRGFGWLPWEFDRGVRNWTLIALYGGLMKIFMAFGAEGHWLHRLISLHNTILALAIVPACWRLGKLYGGELAGWTAAALGAFYPPIVYFTPHPLSEVPAMVLSTWGLTLWLEGRGREKADELKYAFLAAALLGMSVVMRFFSAMLLIVPCLDYAVRIFRRPRTGLAFFLGALVPIAVLGLSDWVTWGAPFHSAIEYFRYNILEWGNADHGVSPWDQYFLWSWQRVNWGLIVLVPFFILGLWRTRLLVLTSAFCLAVLSLIAHKEERFMVGLLPLFLVTFAAGLAVAGGWLKDRLRYTVPAAVLSSAVLVATGGYGVSKLEWHWLGGYFDAQAWVGQQKDVTGCMFTGRIHLSGGATTINKNVPMDSYQSQLGRNPLFNYFIFPKDSADARLAATRHWIERARIDEMIVYQKPPPPR
jgi:phosphatidylinositol glycan class B